MPAVPFRVLVLELAVEHPGDDLHVLMRMRAEAGARAHHVVVRDQQQAVMRVLGIVVIREAEAVPRVEPGQARVKPLAGPTDVDRRSSAKDVVHGVLLDLHL